MLWQFISNTSHLGLTWLITVIVKTALALDLQVIAALRVHYCLNSELLGLAEFLAVSYLG